MEVLTYQFQNFLWIQVPEELDQHASDIIRKKCEIIFLDNKRKHVVFDFSKTIFMDSGGVGMIMGRYRQIKPRGGQVYIYRPGKRILRILEISGLMRIVNICENMEQMEVVMERS
ncbi:MAG: STAS domain-containing protein [Lachnospiraceae bacterium]|nr:STAS domain-containing protein [Lachnospiraceae bacterium]